MTHPNQHPQDKDWDAPHWARYHPEVWPVYGNCGNCAYGHIEGIRRGECMCLLHSTTRTQIIKLTGDRCPSWDGGR